MSDVFLIGTLNNLHKGAQKEITESTGLGTNRITADVLVPKQFSRIKHTC
jgi:phosphopantetheine adenylyltransferase